MSRLFLLTLLVLAGTAQAAVATLDEALAEAGKRKAPVLLDFHAPWCYSCYYMKKNVLNGREWQRVERDTVILDVDADSPEGAALKERFQVKALPSYVVLNAEGDELGRISAERTRAQFYPELAAITDRNTALMVLRGRAERGGTIGLEASREVLESYVARRDHAAGLAWYTALPEAVRSEQQGDARVQRLLARLELQQAVAAQEPAACLAAGTRALSGKFDCDSPYDLDQVLNCTDKQPAEERRERLLSLRAAHDLLLEQRVLGQKASCADIRTAVFVAADYYHALGDTRAEAQVMRRAIAGIERGVFSDPKADRNAADNLRVFLEADGQDDKLDALLVKLIAAYPDDYVYPNRYARLLAKRGQHQKALPYFEQAAGKAYGINRLKNAEAWTQSLLTLHRQDEARRVVAETLKANGPWFPDDAARLKKLVISS